MSGIRSALEWRVVCGSCSFLSPEDQGQRPFRAQTKNTRDIVLSSLNSARGDWPSRARFRLRNYLRLPRITGTTLLAIDPGGPSPDLERNHLACAVLLTAQPSELSSGPAGLMLHISDARVLGTQGTLMAGNVSSFPSGPEASCHFL